MNIFGNTIFTVTQIANQAKSTLENKFDSLWIQGEISSCKPYSSGHIYLTLKDEKCELSAVIFSLDAQYLTQIPQLGQKVTVNGSLSIYAPKGKFQLQIKNIYPAGQGDLWLAYESLKQKLENQGLFDQENKKNIPRFPKRIGIITSLEGAALRDILQVLKRRTPHLSCLIYPVPVQGNSACEKISGAIVAMNEYQNIDTLILGRGGGSMEDLWCFNDEKVVRSIYESDIPVITGIGHETDITLSDYVADLRASTPSTAAELVSDDRQETMQLIDLYSEKLCNTILQNITTYRERLNSYHKRHGLFMPRLIIKKMNDRLKQNNMNFRQATLSYLQNKQIELGVQYEKIQLLNPDLQMKRGFSIITDENQRIIFSPRKLKLDDIVNIQVANGKFAAKVIAKRNNND